MKMRGLGSDEVQVLVGDYIEGDVTDQKLEEEV